MMQALDKDLRSALEKTVKAARTVAETAAQAAVDQLGVGHDKPEAFLSDDREGAAQPPAHSRQAARRRPRLEEHQPDLWHGKQEVA
jgi:hypothetical protein